MNPSLPIWQLHQPVLDALKEGNRLVLVAPPGSGKTTQVPSMILDAGLAGGGQVVVLQPRRVAARSVAARVAYERGSKLGEEVGYQIRFEDRTSLGTKLCFITEGILLRWLQDDSNLTGVGAILFDEFHERNLQSDVALGLARRIQKERRPDLKLVVMSATLEAEPVADYLEGCPILHSEGRVFGVETYFLDQPDERSESDQAADVVERIVNRGEVGDILVFMPGKGEINATLNALRAAHVREPLALIPLHGELQPEEQDTAFQPNERRKVIVSTNVAETSVTIDGVRHVVDCGVARVARYDSERGIHTLFIEEISRASAEQRKGRAGRTAPGTCHRLWTENNHLNRPERNTPEIQRADLAEVVLLLHSLGINKASEFEWLDKPDPSAVGRAEDLLRMLGAIAPEGTVPAGQRDLTPVGERMLRLPMHPRYSRMLVEASRRGCGRAAALCAALVGGRDLMMRLGRDDKHISEAREVFEGSALSDFFTLMRAFQFARQQHFSVDACRRYGVHAQTARQVAQTFDQILDVAISQGLIQRDAPDTQGKGGEEPLIPCLVVAFLDQLCVRRSESTLECDLMEGRSGTLVRESVVQDAPMFVAGSIREVSGRTGNMTLLSLATGVKYEQLREWVGPLMRERIEHAYDRTHKRVAVVKLTMLRDLVVKREFLTETDPIASGRALAEAYLRGAFELPLFNHEVRQFMQRANLIAVSMPELEFPAFDRDRILSCLTRAFKGVTLAKEAQTTPLLDSFRSSLAPAQREWLDELAPTSIPWHDGKRQKLVYPVPPESDEPPEPPEVQLKLHECFPLKEHPRIIEGRVPVKFWLCAPDGKRIESTQDWPAFRAGPYARMKAALQKKYPGFTWL